MNLLFEILIGLFLGVSLAAPPGPVTSIIIKRSVNSAYRGILVGFGAMTADFILLLIVIFSNTFLVFSIYEKWIYLLGSVITFYFSYNLVRNYRRKIDYNRSGSYMAGFTIGLVNPFQIIWWLTSGLAFLLKFGLQVFYFLFLGTTVWVVFLSFTIKRLSEAYGEKIVRAASLFSLAVLVFFASLFFYLFLTLL